VCCGSDGASRRRGSPGPPPSRAWSCPHACWRIAPLLRPPRPPPPPPRPCHPCRSCRRQRYLPKRRCPQVPSQGRLSHPAAPQRLLSPPPQPPQPPPPPWAPWALAARGGT
jgi:hypothetical protein